MYDLSYKRRKKYRVRILAHYDMWTTPEAAIDTIDTAR